MRANTCTIYGANGHVCLLPVTAKEDEIDATTLFVILLINTENKLVGFKKLKLWK